MKLSPRDPIVTTDVWPLSPTGRFPLAKSANGKATRPTASRCSINESAAPKRLNFQFAYRSAPASLRKLQSKHKRLSGYFWFQKQFVPAKYILTVTIVAWYPSLRSMKTCLHISTVSWPIMSVAKATRHSRYNQGCVFSLGLSTATIGERPEGNLDRLGVSR